MTARESRVLARTFAEPVFPRVGLPVDVTDETQFPAIAEARRHFASLSPERRAELERTSHD